MSTDGQQAVPSPSAGEPPHAMYAAYPSPVGPYAAPGTPYLPAYPQGLYSPHPGPLFYPLNGPRSRPPRPPAVWPVVVFTLLFGFFGAVSAARRSNRARDLGVSRGRYWGTFAGALVASWLLHVIILVIIDLAR